MKQIENDTIPFGTFVAFNYFGLVFVKRLLLPDERECYDNQADQMYLKRRKWFAWVKYLFKRPVR